MIDWSDGTYELTASELAVVAERCVRTLEVQAGTRALDLGAGTGNGALLLAARGAVVTAVDPAERLLQVAAERAQAAGFTLDVRHGVAEALPLPDATFDVAISIFGLIFSPEPQSTASELVRVLRPGGVAVFTSWAPFGGIAEAGKLLREAMGAHLPAREAPPWGEPERIRALFAQHPVSVEIEEATLDFSAESAEAWFDQQQEHHPVWRFARTLLAEQPATWATLRQRSIAALEAAHSALATQSVATERVASGTGATPASGGAGALPAGSGLGLLLTSPYYVTTVRVAG